MIRFTGSSAYWVWLFAIVLFAGCNPDEETLFFRLPPEQSGVVFVNRVEETPEINILAYEYTYNGGGVAAGDFNNDGLCDLFFSGNTVSNRLYLNKGDLKFNDVTEDAGVGGRPLWKTGVTAADVNGDGWLDLYICYSGPDAKQSLANQLFINNQCEKGGIPTFTERAKEYGLAAEGTYSTQASFFDYDRDGDLDMFLINHGNHFYSPFINTNKLRNTRHPQFGNRLYRNDQIGQGGDPRFSEVSQEAGIHGGGINFGLGVSISDLNADGWPDIFVTNDYEEQDFLYLNNRDGTFTESAKKSFGHFSRNGMGTDIADFNNDGRPDLIEVDMWPEDNYRQKLLKGPDDFNRYNLMVDSGFHHQQMRNTLQVNAGVGPGGVPLFCEIGQLAGVSATDWSWAPLFADLDNDGFKDLFITNGYLRDFTSMDFLKYTVEEARNKARAEGTQLQLYELVSKMASTKTSDYLFRNNGGLSFIDATESWGLDVPNLSFGASVADLDNDGDLELITNNTNEPAAIWVNQSNLSGSSNYLRVRLTGPALNPFGTGARVTVITGDSIQVQEQFPARGYQSSVEPVLHFGLSDINQVDQVIVTWPDGKESKLAQVTSNQVVEVRHQESADARVTRPVAYNATYFRDASGRMSKAFRHAENAFNDFDREPLLLRQLSRLGPALASGDVNGDGVDDLFVGGATGQSGVLYLRDRGQLTAAAHQPWREDAQMEDIGATFFDADSDHDLDLFVVSGGNEFPAGSTLLDDRLYMNEGGGRFVKAPAGATVADHVSGSCVVASDYDKDGDSDLFVGGRLSPGNFPMTAPGAVLRNDTREYAIQFSVATSDVNPGLREPGMVTDAIWTDFNNDTWPDLMIVGHWMPVRLFENRKGRLQEVNDSALANTHGLWNRVAAIDFDNDGDQDYVLGNAGTNLPWKITRQNPLTIYYGDFNTDGRIDPLICHAREGKNYPIASRDEMLGQLTALRKKFTTYDAYANAGIIDILDPDALRNANKMMVTTPESSLLENLGGGIFKLVSLPAEAQVSAVSGILTGDFDDDGFADILVAGNFHPYRTQYGPADASFGLMLRGNGDGEFDPVPWDRSGFFAPGDVRNMVWIRGNRIDLIAVGRNNDTISLIEYINGE